MGEKLRLHSSGNYISNTDVSSATIASVESSFHQDLNGDGTVGAAPVVADGFTFNFDDTLPSQPETPDPMPGWLGAEAASSQAVSAEAVIYQDAGVHVGLNDILNDLHGSGFLLA